MLETKRLLLRDYGNEDWEQVHIYGADPEFSKYELWGPNTTADTKQFVTDMIAQITSQPRCKFDHAITLRESGLLIGGAGLRKDGEHADAAALGWAVTPRFQNRGFATEAAQAFIDFGFKRLKLKALYATCDARNQASFRVMEKLGMKRVAFIKGTEKVKGHVRDSYRYEIINPE